jgi:hypothetical protein
VAIIIISSNVACSRYDIAGEKTLKNLSEEPVMEMLL